jgi:type IV secretion system protein VirB10
VSGRGSIDGERTTSGVASRSRLFTRKQKVTFVLFGGAAAVLCVLYLGQGEAPKASKEYVAPLRVATAQPLTVPPEPRAAPAPTPPPIAPTPSVQQRPVPGLQAPLAPTPTPQMQTQAQVAAPKLLVIDDNAAGDQGTPPARLRATEGAQGDDSDLGKALRPTMLEAVSASIMPHPEMTIAQGRALPCFMDTAIDSQMQGLARCHIPYDIVGEVGARGESGVVLLPRDTVITGEVRAGHSVRSGQTRVGVLWTRARTPDGVVIPLASLATDTVGRSGIAGDVDNHWWARFGNALLFTLIDAGTQIISTELSKGGQTSINLNTAGNVAGDQFREDARIPPTITVHQGEAIGITVARDLDFSRVYRLQMR